MFLVENTEVCFDNYLAGSRHTGVAFLGRRRQNARRKANFAQLFSIKDSMLEAARLIDVWLYRAQIPLLRFNPTGLCYRGCRDYQERWCPREERLQQVICTGCEHDCGNCDLLASLAGRPIMKVVWVWFL